MKKLFFALLLLVFGLGVHNVSFAGYHPSRKLYNNPPTRTNFILPKVDGLNCYTADLHVHTNYSDGSVSPDERVREAWIDGLDIMAITDHIETRKREREMLLFLKGYSPDKKGFEPINTRCSRGKHADERGIVSDLNLATDLALKATEKYPEVTIIRGVEISREPVHIGHYCALFTKDNNTIYSTDDAQTIRNARAQGALITHNHPGWERKESKTTDYSEFEKKVYNEGLIDGVEITNGKNFYPEIVRRAIERKLYMVSGSDIHATSSSCFGKQNFYRDMTLIFAKDKSEKELRKALLSQKTLGYCGGYIIGEESLLTKFFKASVSISTSDISKSSIAVHFVNNSSFAYAIESKDRIYQLEPFQAVTINVKKKAAEVVIKNMIHVDEQYLKVKVK